MTFQTKGFQWSLGIHGTLLLVIAGLQIFAIPQPKVAVIDFTLSGDHRSSAVDLSSLQQTPAIRKEPKRTRSVWPRETAEERNAKKPAADQAALSPASPVPSSSSGEEAPERLPQAADRPGVPAFVGNAGAASQSEAADGGAPSAKGGVRHAGDTAGRARGTPEPSGTAGAGATPETARAAYLKEHFAYIRDRITGSISYPHMARKLGWCGQVKIAFVVCEDGGVNDVQVVESSGFSLLDRNAVDTVKHVAPFPSPPVRAEIRMAITYRLN